MLEGKAGSWTWGWSLWEGRVNVTGRTTFLPNGDAQLWTQSLQGYSCVFWTVALSLRVSCGIVCIAHHREITCDHWWYNYYTVYLEDALGTGSRGGVDGKDDLCFTEWKIRQREIKLPDFDLNPDVITSRIVFYSC